MGDLTQGCENEIHVKGNEMKSDDQISASPCLQEKISRIVDVRLYSESAAEKVLRI